MSVDHEALGVLTLHDVVRAQGLSLALLGKLVERAGLAPAGEFGRLLALLATITGETSDAQGVILGAWAQLSLDARERGLDDSGLEGESA